MTPAIKSRQLAESGPRRRGKQRKPTQAQTAAMGGGSVRTIQRVRRVARDGHPALVPAMACGRITAHAAELIARHHPAIQALAVDALGLITPSDPLAFNEAAGPEIERGEVGLLLEAIVLAALTEVQP